jgi:aminoglycoside/choline kinase family phosphotransferase
MVEDVAIADTPDAVTPDWLTQALAPRLGGDRVTDVTMAPIGTGQMCDSMRLTLRYESGTGELPATMVAKFPAADETSRNTALALGSYENEVRFYQQLAPELPMRTPAVYYSDIDPATASFLLLLEDMAGSTAGDQLTGCSVEQAKVAVDELVKLHAPRWGDASLAELPWLHRDPDGNRAFLATLLPQAWQGFKDRYGDAVNDVMRRAGDELFTHLDAYLAGNTDPLTVVHGDYRLDNLLFAAGPDATPIAVVDWQTCTHGPALQDVGYFIGAGLLPDERREVEDELVRGYHAGIEAAGVTGYGWERCWTDYRRATWAGLVMAVAASMLVVRTDRGDQMFLTMADRHSRHALDLDAPELLHR